MGLGQRTFHWAIAGVRGNLTQPLGGPKWFHAAPWGVQSNFMQALGGQKLSCSPWGRQGGVWRPDGVDEWSLEAPKACVNALCHPQRAR